MAVDEAILESCRTGITPNTLRIYTWQPSAVSIGRHQAIREEVDLDIADNLGINVVRRISGGGAVFHDCHGEVTYSIVVNEKLVSEVSGPTVFFRLAQGISLALSKFGLPSEEEKIHCPSIFVGRKKISGNAQARKDGMILQHGTILLSYDPEIMYSVLKVKEGRTKRKMVQSVFQHVTTLERELGYIPKQETVAEYLVEGFQKSLGIVLKEETPSEGEMVLATKLREEKYLSPKWTFKY